MGTGNCQFCFTTASRACGIHNNPRDFYATDHSNPIFSDLFVTELNHLPSPRPPGGHRRPSQSAWVATPDAAPVQRSNVTPIAYHLLRRWADRGLTVGWPPPVRATFFGLRNGVITGRVWHCALWLSLSLTPLPLLLFRAAPIKAWLGAVISVRNHLEAAVSFV